MTVYQKYNELDDFTSYAYHTIWLRHNCRCEKGCLHPTTKEIIVCSSSFTEKEIAPLRTYIGNNKLCVIWKDFQFSQYSFDWLLAHKQTAIPNIINIKPNVSEIIWLKPQSDSEKVQQMIQIMKNVEDNGYCYVKEFGLDNEEFIKLMDKSGHPLFSSHFGLYENLEPATHNTFNKHTDQLGYTNDRIDLHMDQTFIEDCPPFQALHCIKRAESGGSNMFVDIRKISNMLIEYFPNEAYLLTHQPILFHRKQKEYEKKLETPIIKPDEKGKFKQVRSSYFTLAPFDLPFDKMIPYYNAYNRFHKLIRNPESQVQIQLDPGDVIIYDNHRMMHGRTAFTGYRLIKGTYHMKKNLTQ